MASANATADTDANPQPAGTGLLVVEAGAPDMAAASARADAGAASVGVLPPAVAAQSAPAASTTAPAADAVPTAYNFDVLGVIHSCFKQKFGIPRQPGLAPLAIAELRMRAPWSHPEAVRGMEGWSHLWISFIFHGVELGANFKSTVHPPRGDKKYGVFATRTTHRPNRLGLSVVEFAGVEHREGGTVILLKGVDLLDGTPVVDIKPYLPYADVIRDARAGFANGTPPTIEVEFTREAEEELVQCRSKHPSIRGLAVQVLSQDPRPSYYKRGPAAAKKQLQASKEHCQHLCDVRFAWKSVPIDDVTAKIVVFQCQRLPRDDIPLMFR